MSIVEGSLVYPAIAFSKTGSLMGLVCFGMVDVVDWSFGRCVVVLDPLVWSFIRKDCDEQEPR